MLYPYDNLKSSFKIISQAFFFFCKRGHELSCYYVYQHLINYWRQFWVKQKITALLLCWAKGTEQAKALKIVP